MNPDAFKTFESHPLTLNGESGGLDERSIAIVASSIALRLFDLWPAEMTAILASWPDIAETARLFVGPLVKALDGGANA